MISKITFVMVAASFMAVVQAYSGGAPVDVCEDMIPKHPVAPQKSNMPYTVTLNNDTFQAKDIVTITINGKNGFKGFLLQVRQGAKNSPIGKFVVADTDKYVKSINCGKGQQNAVTHKNSDVKNNLTMKWEVPANLKGQAQVYVTVARDGGTFWTAKQGASFKLN